MSLVTPITASTAAGSAIAPREVRMSGPSKFIFLPPRAAGFIRVDGAALLTSVEIAPNPHTVRLASKCHPAAIFSSDIPKANCGDQQGKAQKNEYRESLEQMSGAGNV
ncbi:hypothetical protein [Ruegeria sp. EL01]|jgi:hypothetical protein|uniref:hypothetical protein n=1 Tax=Ruegeria sp. EL01 TaxID=2107578 RepID=UPI0013C4EF89|nr:hypothetical protein [Ruegeria sp. EL01]